ncbi:unnamed protein product [Rotaria magnacalcarata]|uniref:Apple domain-containing protein n=2 Tax=Rotaria magnacalcarata TaxID=392030 RepID=A0A8S2KZL5_9BILA|nr:unnamed protein product [Rotaria magnacalcarata]CAF3877000.1 unnamed protein product [Rotaria magnacalcarata]CAF3933928.1 unnamed protein product [Rotaria magnacalcarata]
MSSPAHAIYSSTLSLSLQGHEFQSQYDVQLIFNKTAQSRLLCAAACNQNPSCRTFDYDSSSHRCRLFEADLTNGAIIATTSQTSIVGNVILSASLYASMYNQSCSACRENRYQTCSSTTNTCQCPGNSYWNGSMCPLQLFENATCSQPDACRSDCNLSCIINSYGGFTQCLIKQALATSTETVYALWNTTAGSDSNLASNGTGIGKYYSVHGPDTVFDCNTVTKYVNFGDCNNTRGASFLVTFRLATANSYPQRDPLIISIEGSNSNSTELTRGSSWTLLYNGSSGISKNQTRFTYGSTQWLPKHSAWYASYRFLVNLAMNNGASIPFVQYSEFDKNAKTLWETAFNQMISYYKKQKKSSSEAILDIIEKLVVPREELDSKENAIDNQHDLPVYHRIHQILTTLIHHIHRFDNERKLSFRSLAPILLQFDKTFAMMIGRLLIKIAQNRDDLQSILILFQEHLSENYFESVLIQLATMNSNKKYGCFVYQLNVNEKLDLCQWFIKEKDRGLFVFDLLKNHVLINKSDAHREQCQDLL